MIGKKGAKLAVLVEWVFCVLMWSMCLVILYLLASMPAR